MLVLKVTDHPQTPVARIPLSDGQFALVGPEWFDYLMQFNWFLKKSAYRCYAVRTTHINGRKVFIRMHRVIADTPPDMVCHHINGFALDNRRLNLQNMSSYEHTKMYSYR